MYVIKSYEELLKQALDTAPDTIDKREGGIFYTAVAGALLVLAQYYVDGGEMYGQAFLTTAVDEYLDRKGQELGLARNAATHAEYELVFEGAPPVDGDRFFTDGMYFKARAGEGAHTLVAESSGSGANGVVPGTQAVPVNTIQGLKFAIFGALLEPGADTEGDEDYRQRIRDKIAGPAENGNAQHYKTWCEEIDGVGRARIIPLWNGENTVKGVIVGADGAPAAQSVVERVQEHVDPGGSGLGNGAANIGAYFTAVSAGGVDINVSFGVTLKSGYTADQVREQAVEALTAYLKDIALHTPDSEGMTVRISTIGTLIYSLEGVTDYSGLSLNGGTANVEIDKESVAVPGVVSVNENI